MAGFQPYPWRDDPHAGVRRFSDYKVEVRDRCDVVVVGSGPGGAAIAKVLAESGKDVIVVEEGPPIAPREFTMDAGEMMLRMLREGGMRSTRGNVFIPNMQACVLGGGSVVNSAISVRPPDWVFDNWAEQHGTHMLSGDSMRQHYDSVERFLGIEPTPESVQGERNLSFKRGCDALGISSEPCPRNAPGCTGSAECFTGCRTGGKNSTDLSYIPAAIRAGARVYTSLRVDRVLSQGRRATGVTGPIIKPFTDLTTGWFQIDARAVVLAAGCMASPVILQRSGIGNENGQAGKHLRCHPGIAVCVVFPHKVRPWQGATQGYHSMHYLREGLKLEVLWSPPPIVATRLPGFGLAFKDQLAMFERAAPYDVIADGSDSEGSVSAGLGGNPDIKYHLGDRDVEKLHRGACILTDIAFAAGAEAVLPGLYGLPDELKPGEVDKLRSYKMRGQDAVIAGNHMFSSTRMGGDSTRSVVDVDGRCHETDNLYVADSGIIPMSPAVNPMLTVMALAERMGKILAARI
jgi:choline dehydrogenase-like flavoprotein